MHLALSTHFQNMTIHISAIGSSVNMNFTISLNSVNKTVNCLHLTDVWNVFWVSSQVLNVKVHNYYK